MASGDKVVVNLTVGPEAPERATLAFLVASSAASSGKEVVVFLTGEGVRLAVPGVADEIHHEGFRPLAAFLGAVIGAGGELHCCTPCLRSRGIDADGLIEGAKVSGPTNLFAWMGEDGVVFSY